jgi:hypothetical protein
MEWAATHAASFAKLYNGPTTWVAYGSATGVGKTDEMTKEELRECFAVLNIGILNPGALMTHLLGLSPLALLSDRLLSRLFGSGSLSDLISQNGLGGLSPWRNGLTLWEMTEAQISAAAKLLEPTKAFLRDIHVAKQSPELGRNAGNSELK